MAWLRRLLGGLGTLWRRDRIERELDDELRSFLDEAVAHKMQSGLSREQALRAARLELGSETAVKQAVREAGWETLLDSIWRDLVYAARSFARSPGFTAVAVLTLGLGIAANTAIFSVVYAVLLKPLPYKDSGRMVRLFMNAPPSESPSKRQYRGALGLTADQIAEVKARVRSFSHVGTASGTLRGLRGQEEGARIQGAGASVSIFEMIDAKPAIGRGFTSADEQAGAEPVVLLSHAAWQRFYSGDPNIIGRVVTMDSALGPRVEYRYTVVGVMAPEFAYPDTLTYFWLPFQRANPNGTLRTGPLVARLADGASIAAATAEVASVMRGLRPEAPETRYELAFEQRELVAPVRPALLVLMGAVGFVLLIACVNVANLLLARSASRQREMAVRIAIGAGRGRLIRQMLTESVLLAILGGTAGIILAVGAVRLLKTLATTMTRIDVSPGGFPRIESVGIDPWVLAFTVVCCVLIGILFGLAPALMHSQIDPVRGLKGDPATTKRRVLGRLNLRHALVVAEVSLAMMLLVGGGLLIRSFLNLSTVDPGYVADNVLTFQVRLPGVPLSQSTTTLVCRRRRRSAAVTARRSVGGVREPAADGEPQ
jgi:predicted permease